MKHTKVQVIEKAKKVLMELDYDWYFEDTIQVFSSDDDGLYFEEYGGGQNGVLWLMRRASSLPIETMR